MINNILINSQKSTGPKNIIILQYLKLNDINIPRFCYHEKLDIAGNCRMCIIEIEGVNKPITGCTTIISENISIFTHSKMVRKARQAILEFLLLNHPLDCPVCDQGGECDLQEETLTYGPDRSRYFIKKKSAYDFQMGPLIKTTMTRCINCTRCIRFLNFVNPIYTLSNSLLGHLGRGSEVYIGQYVSKLLLDSELSGNIIDLCPVGALTGKGYSFKARPWEGLTYLGYDFFDGGLTLLRINVRDNHVLRILPAVDLTPTYEYNEWISDQTRFSFDGNYNNRLTAPHKIIKTNEKMHVLKVSWNYVHHELLNIINFFPNVNFKVFLGEFLDINTLALLKDFLTYHGNYDIYHLDHRTHFETPFGDFRADFFNCDFTEQLVNNELILTLGVDLRIDMPIYNLVIRQQSEKKNITLVGFGFKSLANYNIISNNLKSFIKVIEGKSYLCNLFKQAEKTTLLYNNCFLMRYDCYNLFYFFQKLKLMFNRCLFLSRSITLLSSFDLGVRTGIYYDKEFTSITKEESFYFFFSTYNFDLKIIKTLNKLRGISFFFGSHVMNNDDEFSHFDYLLPCCTFYEKKAWYVNERGKFVEATKCVDAKSPLQFKDYDNVFSIANLFYKEKFNSFKYNYIETINKYTTLPHKYNYNYIYKSLNYIIFKELYIYNTPLQPLFDDLIFKGNILTKNSLLMHCSYETYYMQQKSIYLL